MKNFQSKANSRSRKGFTLIELLIVIAIIALLTAVLVPAVSRALKSGKRTTAVNQLKTFGNGATMYANDNKDRLPKDRSSDGGEASWSNFQNSNTDDVWYNAIPQVAGFTSAREIAENNDTKFFYNGTSPFYLPGAKYPGSRDPRFAFAMNGALQQSASNPQVKIDFINKSSRTVLFLERGMPGEEELGAGNPAFNNYEYAEPREFVTRYNKTGVLGFVDAHATYYKKNQVFNPGTSELRTWNGTIQRDLIWTVDEREDPNQ